MLYRVMIIGAHTGDAEASGGTIAYKYSRNGHKVFLVAMTQGEGGHATLSREEYKKQKEEEGLKAAETLKAEPIYLPIPSGTLYFNSEASYMVADIIRKNKPDIVITHWKGSFHMDHIATYNKVTEGVFLAAHNGLYSSQYEAHEVKNVYYMDNWEDANGYKAELYIDTTEEEDTWLKACNCYEFFRESFYNYRYAAYYQALHVIRGCESGFLRATSLMLPDTLYAHRTCMDHIPGLPI